MLDAEAGEHSPGGAPSRGVDAGDELLGTDPGEAVEPFDGFGREGVEIGDIGRESGGRQLRDGALAETLDVHGPPRGPVDDALIALERTGGLDTSGVGLTLGPFESTADRARAEGGELPLGETARTLGEHRADHLGNDIAGLADHDEVARTDVFQADLVLVVERRHGDRGAADEHRLQYGERCGATGAADRDLDVEETGGALLWRELERDRPTGRPRGVTELDALREVVDLHHDTVDVVVEIVAVLLPVTTERDDLLESVHHPHLGVHGKTERRDEIEGGAMGVDGGPSHHLTELVGPHRQSTPRGDRRVLLAERTRGRVAGIDEQSLTRLVRLPVELVEHRDRHVDLAADLDHLGGSGGQPMGHVSDRADVGGDILADAPVTAGGGVHQLAALVAETHGQTVDLEFAHEPRIGAVEPALEPLTPGTQLRLVHGVVEAHHRDGVLDRRERGRGRAADRRRR